MFCEAITKLISEASNKKQGTISEGEFISKKIKRINILIFLIDLNHDLNQNNPVPDWYFFVPFSFESSYFDLSLSYVIVFQKANESVDYFLSLRLISFEVTSRDNIIKVSFYKKHPPTTILSKNEFYSVPNGIQTHFRINFESRDSNLKMTITMCEVRISFF